MFGISICPRETLRRTVSPGAAPHPAGGSSRRRCRPRPGVAHALAPGIERPIRIRSASSCLLVRLARQILERVRGDRGRRRRGGRRGCSPIVVGVSSPEPPPMRMPRARRPPAPGAGRAARASASACAESGAPATSRRSAATGPRGRRRDARGLDRGHALGRLARRIADQAVAATGTRPRRTRSRSAENSSALP